MGSCHGNASGKGGFKLSLRGDDPAFDLAAITRESLGRRVNPASPDESLILLKPTGRVPHEGGIRFSEDSEEARTLRSWIAAGTPDDEGTAPRLISLDVQPPQRLISARERSVRLQVTARFDDGTVRDVTRQATFDLSDPTIAEVGPDATVTARQACEVTVAVRYLQGRGVATLAFLPDRPGFVWNGPEPLNIVDEHVFSKLRKLTVNPSPPVADHIFLRRVYLDGIGRLPTPEEARAFLADRDESKHSRLVDELLERPEFADFWALKWADLLRNEEKTMGAKGVWVFQRWLRDQIAADAPLDEVIRQIITARGSNWKNPPSSFYRTNRDANTAAETFAQVFLGVRLQCAKCHNHPFDDWTQDDYYGLAACFSNLKRKEVQNVRRDKLDQHEINGDEILFVSGSPGMVQPRTGMRLPPTPPHGAPIQVKGETDARVPLAQWLTRDNPQFVRNLANRVWFHLMGRGIVDPVDDFRASNPPSNPALLDALTEHLRRQGMRLRPLVALIMKSQTYRLGAAPTPTNAEDTANFARASVRLLPAEVLLDAISQALDVPDRFPRAPRGLRAVQFPGVSANKPLLKVFGKPERLLTCECERSESTTLAQAFQMINGEDVRRKLDAPDNRIGRLLNQKAPAEAILDELYLATLSRPPTPAEREAITAHVRKADRPREAWQDVAWALLNSKEFLLRH
jgi:hypothetical protein